MGEYSKIEWTDHTFNPWLGCTKVSPGCDHCYAESWSKRSGLVRWGDYPRRRTSTDYWNAPLSWNARAKAFASADARRPRVFCASLADVFDNQVPESWRNDLFALVRSCDRLDWLFLTKRPQNIMKMLPEDWGDGYPNVWLGTTAENQKYFDQRWKHLQKIPASITFVSYEPAIGPVRIPRQGPYPNWLISGGESGGQSRSLKPQWVRDVVNDCRQVGIAAFHKQWGSYRNNPLVLEKGLSVQNAQKIDPFGKGGGLLDGELVREFPPSPCRVDRRAA